MKGWVGLAAILYVGVAIAQGGGAIAGDERQYEFSAKSCPDGTQPSDPVPVRTPPPEYPVEARRARIHGTVWVEGRIVRNGQVVDVRVRQGVHRLLDDATVKAVSAWRYEPGRCGSSEVEVFVVTSATFSLAR
jgi:protein TonB